MPYTTKLTEHNNTFQLSTIFWRWIFKWNTVMVDGFYRIVKCHIPLKITDYSQFSWFPSKTWQTLLLKTLHICVVEMGKSSWPDLEALSLLVIFHCARWCYAWSQRKKAMITVLARYGNWCNNGTNIMGVTNNSLIRFMSQSLRRKPYRVPLLSKTAMDWTARDSKRETTINTLLKGHSIKLTLADL